MADVDKVQLWLVKWLRANEEGAAEEEKVREEEAERRKSVPRMRLRGGEGSRRTGMKCMLV